MALDSIDHWTMIKLEIVTEVLQGVSYDDLKTSEALSVCSALITEEHGFSRGFHTSFGISRPIAYIKFHNYYMYV